MEFLADRSQFAQSPQPPRQHRVAVGGVGAVGGVDDRGAEAGDDDQREDAFVLRHQASLWRYLRYLGCPEDCLEDFLHDAFLAAFEHGIPSRAERVAMAWMRTTLRNLLYAEFRQSARRPARVAMDLARLEASWREAEDGSPRWLEALRSGVQSLGPRERLAVDQRYRLGWSRERMAASLGMSKHGVKSLLQRIRHQLRREVERRLADRNADQDADPQGKGRGE